MEELVHRVIIQLAVAKYPTMNTVTYAAIKWFMFEETVQHAVITPLTTMIHTFVALECQYCEAIMMLAVEVFHIITLTSDVAMEK